jgi:hypothetical protein
MSLALAHLKVLACPNVGRQSAAHSAMSLSFIGIPKDGIKGVKYALPVFGRF